MRRFFRLHPGFRVLLQPHTAVFQCAKTRRPSSERITRRGMAADNDGGRRNRGRTYSVTSLPLFGVEVNGIDLRRLVDRETVDAIKEDVSRYRLMVFRGQGVVSGDRQVEISHWFGELDCPFYKHPASPHPEVHSE